MHHQKNQNSKQEQSFLYEKEYTVQPPQKEYIQGDENKHSQSNIQIGKQQRGMSGLNKCRQFGRIINDNGNQLHLSSQYAHSQSQHAQKPFSKNECYSQINSNNHRLTFGQNKVSIFKKSLSIFSKKQAFQYFQNKENVSNYPQQNHIRDNFEHQKTLQKEQSFQNQSFLMVDQSQKPNKHGEVMGNNQGQMEIMRTSYNIIQQNEPFIQQQQQQQQQQYQQQQQQQQQQLQQQANSQQNKLNYFKMIQEDNKQSLDNYLQRTLNPFDRQFIKDPVQIAEYSQPIFEYLSNHQEQYVCKDRIELNKIHQHLTDTMRCLLIDWLTEVAIKYDLKDETQFLCIQLLDIYCRLCYQENLQIQRESYQKIGVCCLLIASKIEEIYPPSAAELVTVCDGAYQLKDIIDQEIQICLKIQFDFSFPTPFTFFLRYSKILGLSQHQYNQGLFVLYLCQMYYQLSPVYNKPSIIACCACFIAQNISENEWEESIKLHQQIISFHSQTEFIYLLNSIHSLAKAFRNPQYPFNAIRKKFSAQQFGNLISQVDQNFTADKLTIQ